MAPSPYWLCPGCGHRNERAWVNCRGEGCKRHRPKKRVQPHKRALRDLTRAEYLEINRLVHGRDNECAVCGEPPKDKDGLQRDHGHNPTEPTFAKPRGLVCWRCNRLMPYDFTLEKARRILEYLERIENYYQEENDGAVAL